MSERRVVATVAIGENGQAWADVSHPLIRRYAERCGADFFSLSGSGMQSCWPGFSKLLLGELLESYDRLLYVDSDILIAPDAPDLFEVVPFASVGATRIDQLPAEEAPAIANGWVANDIRISQELFGEIGWSGCYFNSGTLLFSKLHLDVFRKAFSTAQQWSDLSADRSQARFRVFADQTLFNYWVQSEGHPVFDIGHRYNHTPAFNGRNHRYQSYFYHYVRLRRHRRGDRLRQMEIDSFIMRKTKSLYAFLKQNPRLASWVDLF